MTQDELVLKVSRLYEEKWGLSDTWLARSAIALCMEEAAKVAVGMSDQWATEWRKALKCDSHLEGKSDGADEIAAAIRALKEKA